MAETFNYQYSAQKSDEVQKIRDKYVDKKVEKSNYERIKELDASTTKYATIMSVAIGTISSLILGTGMSCVMMWDMMPIGIGVGLIGMVGCLLAYPVYKSMVKSARAKVQTEILALCDEELK